MKLFKPLTALILTCMILALAIGPAHAGGYYGGYSYYRPSYSYGYNYGYSYPSYTYSYPSNYYPGYYSYGYSYPSYSGYSSGCDYSSPPAKVVHAQGEDVADKLIKELTLRKLLQETNLGPPRPPVARSAPSTESASSLTPDEVAKLRDIIRFLSQKPPPKDK
jgi:hypothetical protein